MNKSIISDLVTNVTPSTGHQASSSNHTVEAYTVVLSMAAHATSMFFGGGSTVAVITAVTTRSNINKYSYMLVLTLFFACICINFVWSPMEITDLLMHHFQQRHPTEHFVAAKTGLYVFLVVVIHVVTFLLTVEAIIRIASCFGRILQKIWPFAASLFAVGWSAVLTAILITKMARYEDHAHHSYIITDHNTRETFFTIILFVLSLSFIALILLAIQVLKVHVYCHDGWPHFRRNKMSLALPEFLISQSQNVCDEVTGGYDNVNDPSTSRTPSPSTPKLLTVSSPEDQTVGSEAVPSVSNSTSKTSSNRLGINMAQMLGRRRHTICQMSDSANCPTTKTDPINKAKQYNYVRKFSVDISALQAQLQNPKVFKEAPFQSDVDLTKKQDAMKSRNSKPLQPLQPLNLKLDESKEIPPKNCDLKADTPQSAGLSVPPPLIMVSNDDALQETDSGTYNKDDDKPLDDGVIFDFKNDSYNKAEKPNSLSLKESSHHDDVTSVPTLESAVTEPSDTEVESNKLARLAIYMGVTFLLSILPVVVTEALRSTMSPRAFLNISTCTLALSTIQTIIYPHLIASSDDVVHRGVRRLNDRLRTVFCRGELAQHAHQVDDTSSTSQV